MVPKSAQDSRPRLRARLRVVAAAMTVALAIVSPARARTAQVCPGPENLPISCFTIDTSIIGNRRFEDYRVTNPNALLFDVATRAELGALGPTAGLYCAANYWTGVAETLPTIAFETATVLLGESVWTTPDGVTHIAENAGIRFTSLVTSDGLALSKFGLIVARDRGTAMFSLQFRPSVDPYAAGIPGLTEDVYINFDSSTNGLSRPSLSSLPLTLQRLLLAVAYRLPSLYRGATDVVVGPTGDGRTLWSLSEVIGLATGLSQRWFSAEPPTPMPTVTLTCDLFGNAYVVPYICVEQPAMTDFRDLLISYGAEYLATNSRTSATILLERFRSWAGANALTV